MKNIILAAIAAFAVGTAVTANAANEPPSLAVVQPPILGMASGDGGKSALEPANSAASLKTLFAEWDRAGFNAPGKPGQNRVNGRDGYVTTGGGYNYMATLIRSAATDVREGRDRDAAPKIAAARRLLAASNLRKE